MELKYGKSQAAAVDPALVPGLLSKYSEIKVLNLPLPPAEQSLGNGICINKKNTALAQAVRKAVDELQAEGKIEMLEKKWGLK